jgi:uncharacterized protein (DUF1810 family)
MTGGARENDPWRLGRFVTAQDRDGTYRRAVAELRAGAKVSHWMWFVFPQLAGLGASAMSRQFAISSLQEARAYLAHPVLGPRLRECARIVAEAEGRTAAQIFGPVDAMKLRSSMTLFASAAGEADGTVFRAVLAKYFGGLPDEATVTRLLRLILRCARRRSPAPCSRGRCSPSWRASCPPGQPAPSSLSRKSAGLSKRLRLPVRTRNHRSASSSP